MLGVCYSQAKKKSGLVIIHKPRDSGLVVQCFLRKNNGSEGKEIEREDKH